MRSVRVVLAAVAAIVGVLLSTVAAFSPPPAHATDTTQVGGSAAALGSGLAALPPARVLDTRIGKGAPTGRVAAKSTIRVRVTGLAGVPTGAGAVVLNVAAVEPLHAGWVTVHPSNTARPTASNLNYPAYRTIANQVIARVDASGTVSVYTSAATYLIADVVGFYPASTPAYVGLTPARLLDTRKGIGVSAGMRPGWSTLPVTVTGRGGVPSTGVAAVVLNVTAAGPTSSGYLTVSPTGQARPIVSNVNYTAGDVVAGMTVATLGSRGQVNLFTSAGAHLVVDVVGWVPIGSEYRPLTPNRIVDTRNGIGAPTAKVASRRALTFRVAGRGGVPTAGVTAVALNVTSVLPATKGYLINHPADTARPTASVVNYVGARTMANSATAKLSADGLVTVYTSSTADVLVDVTGWYAAAAPASPASPSPATSTTTAVSTAQRILELTNAARAKSRTCGTEPFAAVPPLTLDARLTQAAQKHSVDQAVTRTMTHTTPVGAVNYPAGHQPWDRMTARCSLPAHPRQT